AALPVRPLFSAVDRALAKVDGLEEMVQVGMMLPAHTIRSGTRGPAHPRRREAKAYGLRFGPIAPATQTWAGAMVNSEPFTKVVEDQLEGASNESITADSAC